MTSDNPSLFEGDWSGGSSSFDPARLTQARFMRRSTKAELAARVGVSAAAIGQYEAGVNAPRQEVLEKLARALEVRPDFFTVGRPIARLDTVHAHFRSLRSARVSDRQMALAMVTMIWELVFTLERYVSLPIPDLPELPVGTLPAQAADALRKHWRLPAGPVRHLVATAESNGIVVCIRPRSEIEAVDAFSTVIVGRPIIVTTPRRSENVFRHRFSIAHELGHLLLHGEQGCPSARAEREADEFAAAFLTPASAMDNALPTRLDIRKLDQLGRTWGVSPTSLVRRMVERDRTTESSARRAYQRLRSIYDDSADPVTSYPGEVPTMLRSAAELAEEEGAGVHELAAALKMKPREIRNLLGVGDGRPTLRIVTN